MIKPRHLEVLKALCDLPTAPYAEQHVIAWLLRWARGRKEIRTHRDKAGNVYLVYRRGRASRTPLVIEAHMDHPGFIVTRQRRDGRVEAEFRGGVKPSHVKGARAKLWLNEPAAVANVRPVEAKGRWAVAKVEAVRQQRGKRFLHAILAPVKAKVLPGTLGMWDLPDAGVKGGLFAARVCDDIAGVAAIVCLMEELIAGTVAGHVVGLCSRAEEVGFAGVLAACERRWVAPGSPVIGLETSKGSAGVPQGEGPVIRVGDRTGLFSAGLTHFITQAAGHIADGDASFKYQRKLMDGGTCNSTAFTAFGYDAAGICVALGNYHNMTLPGETGWKAAVGGKAGPGIASETIHLGDFAGMVRLLVEVARRFGGYKRGFGAVRERFSKMHREEQRELLYATSDQR